MAADPILERLQQLLTPTAQPRPSILPVSINDEPKAPDLSAYGDPYTPEPGSDDFASEGTPVSPGKPIEQPGKAFMREFRPEHGAGLDSPSIMRASKGVLGDYGTLTPMESKRAGDEKAAKVRHRLDRAGEEAQAALDRQAARPVDPELEAMREQARGVQRAGGAEPNDVTTPFKRDMSSAAKVVIDTKAKPPTMTPLRDFIDQTIAGFGSTATDTAKGIGIAAGALPGIPEKNALTKAADSAEALIRSAFPGDPGRADEFISQMGQGTGSMLEFLLSNIVGRTLGRAVGMSDRLAGNVATAGAGAAVQGTQGYEDAEKLGAPAFKRYLSFLTNAAVGTSEALPISHYFDRLGATFGSGRLAKALANSASQSAEEFIQEFGQQVGSDIAAKLIYDPNRKVDWEASLRQGLIGAAIGGPMGLVTGFGGHPEGAAAPPPPPPATAAGVAAGLPPGATATVNGQTATAPGAPPPPPAGAAPLPHPGQTPAVDPNAPVTELPTLEVNPDDRAILKADGWMDAAIEDMGDDERADAVAEAKARGVTVPQQGQPVKSGENATKSGEKTVQIAETPKIEVVDKPTAEPVSDITAQLRDLADPQHPRGAVYITKATVLGMAKDGADMLRQAHDAGNNIVANIDGKGGWLVAKNAEVAEIARKAKADGVPVEKIVGLLTGSGDGKTIDDTAVVQQINPAGNVTQETAVTPAEAPAVQQAMTGGDRVAQVVPPDVALQARDEKVKAEELTLKSTGEDLASAGDPFDDVFEAGQREGDDLASAGTPLKGDGSRTAPVVVDHPDDLSAKPDVQAALKASTRRSAIKGMEGEQVADPHADDILKDGDKALAKVNDFLAKNGVGSLKALSGGASSVVLDAGENVVRMGRGELPIVPDLPQVLRPIAEKKIGKVRVQILPKLDTANITDEDVAAVKAELAKAGYEWTDAAPDNLGRRSDGSLAIFDGGVKAAPPAAKPIRDRSARKTEPKARRYPLLRDIARWGGLAPHPDLKAMDLDKLFLPGLGRLIRKKGLSLDAVRERMQEAGYFGYVDPNAENPTTTDDAITLIDEDYRELRPGGVRPVGEEAPVEVPAATITREQAENEIAATLEGSDADPEWVDRAVDIMMGGEGDPGNALERASIELNNEQIEAETLEPIADEAIPGWDDALQPKTAPQDGEPSRPGGEERAVEDEAGEDRRSGEATPDIGEDFSQAGEPVDSEGAAASDAEGPAADDSPGGAPDVNTFIERVEADLAAGRRNADLAPTKSLDAFRRVAEKRGWTLAAYGKGKALWSPDRRYVMFDSVQVEGNHVQVQWATPSEGIAPPPITEKGADGKPQTVLPGAEKITQGEQAQRGADKPLKPTVAQKPADIGMFGDEKDQLDLVDMAKKPAAATDPFDDIYEKGQSEADKATATEKPNRLVIQTGVVLRTVSGRETSPAPKIDGTSDRKTATTLKRMDAWLLSEAKKEVADNDYQSTLLAGMNPAKLSPSDRDTLNDILFGNEEGATEANVVRVEGKAKPAKKPTPSRPTAGWVIREKATGKVVMETFDKAKVDALNTEKYEAVPIAEHLASITGKPKPDTRTTSEVAKSAVKNLAGSADAAMSALAKMFNDKSTLGMGVQFSPETYAAARPLIRQAAVKFKEFKNDVLELVRRMVVDLRTNFGLTREGLEELKPYIRKFSEEVQSGEETLDDALGSSPDLEPDSGPTTAGNRLGETDVPAAGSGNGQGAGPGGKTSGGRGRAGRRGGVSKGGPAALGADGNLEVPERQPELPPRAADSGGSERSDNAGEQGLPPDRVGEKEAADLAAKTANLAERRAAQGASHTIQVVPGKANIAATLPMLFPEQQDDVFAAEQRYDQPDGHGMLFTNGTGTGKTYSGLGVVKRFIKRNKSNILIVAPSQGILTDWQRSAKDLGIDASVLDSTQTAGKGVVLTTYANFGQNRHLADREWDLVVTDEAHKLTQGQNGDATEALRALRALTLHPSGLMQRAQMVLRKERDAYEAASAAMKPYKGRPPQALQDAADAAYKAFNDKAKPLIDKWSTASRPKALMMSATPFAYHYSLDYAEGYLYELPKVDDKGGYNDPTARDAFYIENLGYRKRYGKLTKPDADVDTGVMERQLHEKLKKSGALVGRALEVDKDYDRKFVLSEDKLGTQIDQAMTFLTEADDGHFRPLLDAINKKFDYLARMRLLEAINARGAVKYVKDSLALGRKVVVFHHYNEGGGFNPFDLNIDKDATVTVGYGATAKKVNLAEMYAAFKARNPYVDKLKFNEFRAPIAELTKHYPDALVYNGTVSKKKRDEAKTLFNDDESGRDLIIVQADAGEAGISLHDTTGKHQRVVLELGMPIKPTSAIQLEGRIYRVGQASNALFRYMTTGTNWERWTFAGKISERAGTAENFAMGDQARAIKQTFIDSYTDADHYPPEKGEGTGGKAKDKALNNSLSEWEKAKTHYFAQQKKSGRRDSREGIDYFATPEPIGLKMVELAGLRPNERILEPSAGHGAIARYFPEDAHRTIVEPSSELASKAALNAPGARAVIDRFENLNLVNKYDAIVMNPPFGHAGATAIAHLAKAAKHLANGGRIVALIPRGATDGKFSNWMESDDAEGIYQVANILLPTVTFDRAGTSVSARIVVLEKQTDAESRNKLSHYANEGHPQLKERDYSDVDTIKALFDRMENLELNPRVQPVTADPTSPTAEEDVDDTPDATAPVKVTFKTAETVHAKTGENLFVASIEKRLDRADYDRVAAIAKKHKGYYSTYAAKGAIPGFQFKSAAVRDAFIAEVSGKPSDESTVYTMVEAWHGTQARFDRFDSRYINTGEGAQVFGHGLYFAGKEGVATGYREALAGRATSATLLLDGQDAFKSYSDAMPLETRMAITELWGRLSWRKNGLTTPEKVVETLAELKSVLETTIKNFEEAHAKGRMLLGGDYRTIDSEKHELAAIREALGLLNAKRIDWRQEHKPGHLYRVAIDIDDDQMLDWDKPISEQPTPVRNAIYQAARAVRKPNVLDKMAGAFSWNRDIENMMRETFHETDWQKKKGSDFYNDLAWRLSERLRNKRPGKDQMMKEQFRGAKAASEALRRAGVRGIRYLDAFSRDPATDKPSHNYVVFPGEDDAVTITQMTMAEAAPAPTYYSAAIRAVEASKTAKATPEQWLATLKNAPGVKQEELDWIGVEDWLKEQNRPGANAPTVVTREALADFMRANQIEVKDDLRGSAGKGGTVRDTLLREYDEWLTHHGLAHVDADTLLADLRQENENFPDDDGANDSAIEWLEDYQRRWNEASVAGVMDEGETETRWENWQLPGGENYRELLLTLPQKSTITREEAEARLRKAYFDPNAWETMTPAQREKEIAHEQDNARVRDAFYHQQHWGDTPNPLAHVRFNERTVKATQAQIDDIGDRIVTAVRASSRKSLGSGAPSVAVQKGLITEAEAIAWSDANSMRNDYLGKPGAAHTKRTLFIEEIQSDWHQAGRKQGYRGASFTIEEDNGNYFGRFANGKETLRFTTRELAEGHARQMASTLGSVPDAPFKTTWPELALKRMIRWAAENGFDQVAWTPGIEQVKRFEAPLRQQVKSIEWSKSGDRRDVRIDSVSAPGMLHVDAKGVVDQASPSLRDAIGEPIEEIVGKDIARRIMEEESGKVEGEGLTIGGKGMSDFYDKILVNAANKLGKKFGAKVGQAKLTTPLLKGEDDDFNFVAQAVGAGRGFGVRDVVTDTFAVDGLPDMEAAESAAQKLNASDSRRRATTVHSLPITAAMRESVMGGQPLFAQEVGPRGTMAEQVERRQPPRIKLWPEHRERIENDLQSIVSRIAGRRIPVNFADTIPAITVNNRSGREAAEAAGLSMRPTVGGYYQFKSNGEALIYLALNDPSYLARYPREVLAAHEAWHHVERIMLDENERRLISDDLARGDESAIRRYVAAERNSDINDPYMRTMPDLELTAWAFQHYFRLKEMGQQPAGLHIALRKAFDRIIEMLRQIKKMLRGHGIETVDDLFESVRKGDVSRRYDRDTTIDRAVMDGFETAMSAQETDRGTFDPNDPSMMAARIPTVTPPAQPPAAGQPNFWRQRAARRIDRLSKKDRARIKLQDKFLSWKRLQEDIEEQTGIRLPEGLQPYLHEGLYKDRAAARVADLEAGPITDLIDAMNRRGAEISAAEFDDYLYARHATERNAVIRGRDPTNDAGSGMTDQEAATAMAGFAADPRIATFEAAARIYDSIVKEARRTLLRAGLIDRQTFDEWEAQYQYYAPLRGWEADPSDEHAGVGRGLDVRGKEAKTALGRRSLADSPLAYALMQAEQAIVRAEKNKVMKSVLKLVTAYPDPTLYEVARGKMVRYMGDDGLVHSRWQHPSADWNNPNLFGIKVGGKTTFIEVHHEGLSRALRGAGNNGLNNGFVRGAMFVARIFSGLATRWNPDFIFTNPLRDIGTALGNITDVENKPAGVRRRIIKDAMTLKAVRGIIAALRDPQSNKEYARYFEEFRHAGGKISYLDMGGVDDQKKRIERLLNRGAVREGFEAIGAIISGLNDALENGTRLSAYVALRKAGFTIDQAAMVAKELTVNFSRHGEWGPYINAAYLFFNASIQGTTRFAQAAARSRKVQAALIGITVAGIGMDLMNAMLAGDDDDDRNYYDAIPDWIKERNIILFWGPGKNDYFMWPAPYGWNAPYVVGQNLSALLRGARTPGAVAANVASTMMDAFNPIGMATSLIQFLSPTALDPAVQIAENKNFYGGRITPPRFDDKKPWSQTFNRNTPEPYKWIAREINAVTGGSIGRPGAVDISPEWIEHYVDTLGSGAARFVSNMWKTGDAVINGKEILPENIPVVRRFYGTQDSTPALRNAFYEIWDRADQAHYEVKQLMDAGDKAAAIEARDTYKVDLQAYEPFSETRKALKNIQKRRDAITGRDNLSTADREKELTRLDELEREQIRRSISVYDKLQSRH